MTAGGSWGSAQGPTQVVEDDEDDEVQGVTYLHGHSGPVYAVDASHDMRVALSGSGDGTVRLWSM